MGTLREKLSDPATRQKVIDEAVKVIDAEVSDKGGLGGMAIKAAYGMVKGLAPGMVAKLLNNMLNDFMGALEPFYEQATQAGIDFKAYAQQHQSAVADALLGVTDARAQKSDAGALKKGYEKLRPTAKKHVEQAVPRLADLVKSFA